MKVSEQTMAQSQGYEARGVIARLGKIGEYQQGIMLRIPIYKFITLDAGEGKQAIPVEFVRQAPFIKDEADQPILDIGSIEPGHFVIAPGFIYKKTAWFPNLTAAHMKALQTYRRKDIIVAERDDAEAIELPDIDMTSDQVTKHMKKDQRRTVSRQKGILIN